MFDRKTDCIRFKPWAYYFVYCTQTPFHLQTLFYFPKQWGISLLNSVSPVFCIACAILARVAFIELFYSRKRVKIDMRKKKEKQAAKVIQKCFLLFLVFVQHVDGGNSQFVFSIIAIHLGIAVQIENMTPLWCLWDVFDCILNQ